MSRIKIFHYTGLTLLMLFLAACGNSAQTAGSESEAAPADLESETSLDEQLAKAIADDDLSEMVSLLEAGADANAQYKPGRPVLFLAALQGNAEAARLLIANGADVDAETVDGAILASVAWEGQREIVEILLDSGADVNATGGKGANKLTSVFTATLAEDSEMVKLLIEHDAEINQPDLEGNIPLGIAAGLHPSFETVSLLLENDANIDHQNDKGETALHLAARQGTVSNSFDSEIVRILIEHGASLDIEDEKGRTALDLVGSETEIEKMLLEAGAGK